MKRPMMLDMQDISGPKHLLGLPQEIIAEMMPQTTEREYIMPNGLTGAQWNKRKSRSKIAKQSRKRNRR
jgi:hypothetical protein